MTAVRVVISGRVQGVWFRAWIAEAAGKRGLGGWVRNRRDGAVEAVFSGPAEAIEGMVEACWSGPPMARVVDVQRFDHDETVEPGFHVLPSL